MKLSTAKLRKLIREELARGIPDYAFSRVADELTNECADELLRVLSAHINQTSPDSIVRTKKFALANKICSALRRDREFAKDIEEKLKEKVAEFIDFS